MTCGSPCGAPGPRSSWPAQALPRAARGRVPDRVQVARRPDHADPRPGRVPAGAARDDRQPGRRPSPPTWTRSRSTCGGAAAGPSRDLVRGLRSARFARLRQDWRAVLEQAAAPARRKPAAAALAAAGIAAAHRQVLADGAAITPGSPAREPARPAQALQGTALPAGDLRLAARAGRAVAGGQGAQGPAGLPGRVPGHRGAAGRDPRVRRADDGRAPAPRRRRCWPWARSRPGLARRQHRGPGASSTGCSPSSPVRRARPGSTALTGRRAA